MRTALLAACAVCVASCLSGGESADAGADASQFVALDHDFGGFQAWQSYYLGDLDLPAPHVAGPCYVYINHLAPAGATHYPEGTIIMKVTKPSDDPSTWQLFAMAKRGGDFNAAGAVGWEWFELTLGDAGPIIGWRGESPPPSAGYTSLLPDGGFVDGSCNTCHALIPDQDYVADSQLAL